VTAHAVDGVTAAPARTGAVVGLDGQAAERRHRRRRWPRHSEPLEECHQHDLSLGEGEQLYPLIHDAMRRGDLDWAEFAAVHGFADRGHMIRRLRQHTGLTPEQLRPVAPSDEALWGYRLLGQRFDKPSTRAARGRRDVRARLRRLNSRLGRNGRR
jgi:AraC-like DNA-binding protein